MKKAHAWVNRYRRANAWFLVRIVVSYRAAIGEINVAAGRAFPSVAGEIAPEADQNLVANGAGMHDGRMPDRDIVSDEAGEIVGQVQHGVVLNVRVVPDHDAVDVAAHHGVVPDA